MTDIINNFEHPVILDDARDPNVSWQHHLQRGSLGGVDLAYPFGTSIESPAAGRIVADHSNDGSGGRMATLYIDHPSIAYIQFLHLQSVASGQVSIGGNIGVSGASAFGSDRGVDPHLHMHAYDKGGRRVNLWNYFNSNPSAPAGGGSAPVVGPVVRSGADWAYRRPQGELAKRVARALIGKGRLPADYNNDGDPREVFDKAVQKTLNFSGVFKGQEDGKIERGGCYGIQDYAIKFGDYLQSSGVRDGRPEGLSWACFALGLERP